VHFAHSGIGYIGSVMPSAASFIPGFKPDPHTKVVSTGKKQSPHALVRKKRVLIKILYKLSIR